MARTVGELVVNARGAEQYRLLRRALKEAGEGGLKRDMNARIRRAANTRLLPALRGAALALPDTSLAVRRDGKSLRQHMAAAIQVSVTQNGVRVICNRRRMPAGAESLPAAFEKGKWRHPVFPDPSKTRGEWRWVEQKGKRWFRPTAMEHERTFRDAVDEAVQDTIRKLER